MCWITPSKKPRKSALLCTGVRIRPQSHPFITRTTCHVPHNEGAVASGDKQGAGRGCDRRALFLTAPLALCFSGTTSGSASAASRNKELEKVFYEAMDAMENGDPTRAEALWTRAIQLAPEVSMAGINVHSIPWADTTELESALHYVRTGNVPFVSSDQRIFRVLMLISTCAASRFHASAVLRFRLSLYWCVVLSGFSELEQPRDLKATKGALGRGRGRLAAGS
eukprot:9502472-Pyramimonas_sp.AAC.1